MFFLGVLFIYIGGIGLGILITFHDLLDHLRSLSRRIKSFFITLIATRIVCFKRILRDLELPFSQIK